MADPTSRETFLDRPFTKPDDERDGIGPTLGEDVGPTRQRREDARHGAHDVVDAEEED